MISQGFAPCKGCKRRHELCHDGCPDYAEFRKRVEEIRAKEREANGGETAEEKAAREQREAEEKAAAEKKAQEEREAAEKAEQQKKREHEAVCAARARMELIKLYGHSIEDSTY